MPDEEAPAEKPKGPSQEARDLAEIANDTLEAFQERFYGVISWSHPMPGMVAVDPSASKQEDTILKLLEQAYVERLRARGMERFNAAQEARRATQLENQNEAMWNKVNADVESLFERMGIIRPQARPTINPAGVVRIPRDLVRYHSETRKNEGDEGGKESEATAEAPASDPPEPRDPEHAD